MNAYQCFYGDNFKLAKSCIDSGFSSVMLDGSHHPFDENAELTKWRVVYAHEREVTVKGEPGVLAGVAREDAGGIPEEQLRRGAASAVCKINIDSDGRLAMTAIIRKIFAANPAEFDPRKYLGPGRIN